MTGEIEFEWDDRNIRHLAAHRIKSFEFEQVMTNDPLDLDFESMNSEERYRSVGITNKGRLLSVVWTIRGGKVRAVTAFPATVQDKQAFLKKTR